MKQQTNVFKKDCPSRKVLTLISSKWVCLVVKALSEKPHRPAELLKKIDGISHKVLTQTLRNLEKNRLVTRQIHASVPPKVEYSLTELGQELQKPLKEVCGWAEAHALELI
jgi:DNA-binding HxlR family transcriptional regulator